MSAYAVCMAGVHGCFETMNEIKELMVEYLPVSLCNLTMTLLSPMDEYPFWRQRCITPNIVKQLSLFTQLKYVHCFEVNYHMHALGVSELAYVAARGLGATAKETQTLVTAALLFNIGYSKGSNQICTHADYNTRTVVRIAWLMHRLSDYYLDPQLLLNLIVLITGESAYLNYLPIQLEEVKEETSVLQCTIPPVLRTIVYNKNGLDVYTLESVFSCIHSMPSNIVASLCTRQKAIDILQNMKPSNYLLTKDLDRAFIHAKTYCNQSTQK